MDPGGSDGQPDEARIRMAVGRQKFIEATEQKSERDHRSGGSICKKNGNVTWRRVPESNRSSRICNPLRNLSANPPP